MLPSVELADHLERTKGFHDLGIHCGGSGSSECDILQTQLAEFGGDILLRLLIVFRARNAPHMDAVGLSLPGNCRYVLCNSS